MVDEQDGSPLTPEQDAAVRRLVAEARHDEPIPATVAARLDKVLDHLATESAQPAVTDLDAHRRRRRAGRLLIAAAAVVVGGVALGQVLGTGGLVQSGDDAGSAADPAATAERNTGADDEPAGGTDDGQLASPQEDSPADGDKSASAFRVLRDYVPVTLTSGGFDAEVRKVYRQARLAKRTTANKSLVAEAQPFECPDASYGDGLLLPAYYDGEPAVLAFRPPVGSQRVAELLACGTAEQLGSLALSYGPRD